MEFLLPQALFALALVPIAAGLYVLQQRRRAADAERFGHPVTRPSLSPAPSGWRHVAPALFLLSTTLLIIGAGRPIHRAQVPQEAVRVILALDISGSMAQSDVAPTRLAAATAVAAQFARDLPPGAEMGLVTFNTTANLEVPPTKDRQHLSTALEGLNAEKGTAIGDAIQASIAALTPQQRAGGGGDLTAFAEANSQALPKAPAPQGTIVLLSDGDNSHGSDPREMSDRAAALGVRIYTIGLGNPEAGAVLGTLNEELLAEIAGKTNAKYLRARSLEDLQVVYKNLATSVVLVEQKQEQASAFALAGLGLALLGSLFSLFRANRLC